MARTLADLRDIHLPPPPEAIGFFSDDRLWGVVVAMALVLVAALLALAVWRFRRRALRAALAEIEVARQAYGADQDATALARALSRVLRRHAVTRFPQAAGLIGDAWLAFLDAHGPGGLGGDSGWLLAELPYRPMADPPVDPTPLVEQVCQWLRSNP